jgi:hypothetical protein
MLNMTNSERLDKLSNLREQLCRLDIPCPGCDSNGLHHAREGVINGVGTYANSLSTYANSRYHLGRALHVYKGYFKAEKRWVAVAKVIGAALSRDEKTIFRIIEDFERADQLPAITIEALLEQNIDPAAHKHAEAVEDLLEMPEPETPEEATSAVSAAMKERSAQRRKKTSSRKTKAGLEEFTDWIVKPFEERYRSFPPEHLDRELQYVFERIANTLRSSIRELRQYSRPALVPKPATREVVA